MSQPPSPSAEGQEVLVLDADDKVLKGLERLLGDAGMIVTGTPDPARARDQIINKFFAVALVDVDTPAPGEGIEFLKFVREKSPLTSVLMLTPRKAFEAALAAFREGAADVMLKQPESVAYLRERVISAASDLRTSTDRGRILEEAYEIHEEFLRRMMDLHRQVVDLEDKVLGRTPGSPDAAPAEILDVLVVDDDSSLFAHVSSKLTEPRGWRVREALTGGEALDLATQAKFHAAVVKENLPDLPGSMVLKSVKQSNPDAVALLYTPPQGPDHPGEVKMVEQSRLFTLIPTFSNPDQIVTSLAEVREAFQKKSKERRYLLAFRQHHFEFIKRYQEIRQRIAKVLERVDPQGSQSSSASKLLPGLPKR